MATITPTVDAATDGMFGPQEEWPIVPIHAALARNGHLVTFGTPVGQAAQGGQAYDDWNPAAGFARATHVDTDSMDGYNSFCNALVELADGRLLMVGGNSQMSTMLYDPATGAQVMGADLDHQRWYATSLRLADGRVLVLGGADSYYTNAWQSPDESSRIAVTPEIGSGTAGWTSLTGAADTAIFGAADNHWWYPRAFNGADGSVVGTSGDVVWTLSTAGNGAVHQIARLPFFPGVSGSQVMFAPGQILVAGGDQHENGDQNAATAAAAVISTDGGTATVTPTAPMASPRNWLNLTVLPTGEVFANGGTRVGINPGDANSVKQAEIWNPATGQWRSIATAQRTRTYHSTSLVLPSGAVFTGGGGVPGPEDNFNAELYYPASLFTRNPDGSVQWASRPAITAISGSATYGGDIALEIGDGRAIKGASLISLPAVTHSENTDQRRIPLDVSQQGATVKATLPASINTMPPGDYELTVVDANGVPSPAQIVTVRQGAAGSVTVTDGAQAPTMSSPPVPGGTEPGAGAGTAAGTAAGPTPTDGSATNPGDPGATTGPGAAAGTGTPPGTGPEQGGGAAPGPGAAPGSGTAGSGETTGTANPGTGAPTTISVGARIGLASVAHPALLVRHAAKAVSLQKTSTASSATLRGQTTWIVHRGLSSKKGLSFEAADRAGYYLVAPKHGGGRLTLAKRIKGSVFAARATFSATKGASGVGVSFRLRAHPRLVIRALNTHLLLSTMRETRADRAAASFSVRKGLATARGR